MEYGSGAGTWGYNNFSKTFDCSTITYPEDRWQGAIILCITTTTDTDVLDSACIVNVGIYGKCHILVPSNNSNITWSVSGSNLTVTVKGSLNKSTYGKLIMIK